jgi:hypothetical protein
MQSYDVDRDLEKVRQLRPLLRGLEDGSRRWQEYAADVAGPDQTAAAIELCRAELKAAVQRLTTVWLEIGRVAFPARPGSDTRPAARPQVREIAS